VEQLNPGALAPWQVTEKLQCSRGSKDVAEFKTAVFGSDIRLEHVYDFPEGTFKTATDSILLLIFAWWNFQDVVADSSSS
jgi:hypothetical protein